MDLRRPAVESVEVQNARLQDWLRARALPLWDEHGVDRHAGGYFEHLDASSGGTPITAGGALRRGRVVARQLYVFDLGHRLGWRSSRTDPVSHGSEYLFSTLLRADGLFHTAVSAATGEPSGEFSLYEHAFYLFALARLQTHWQARFPVEETAVRCLGELRRGFGRPTGGFEESRPPTAPLKSNPHMHLLEAALEWIGAASATRRPLWIALARELVALCLKHFIDPRTGAVREYFADDWGPAPGDAGRIVEPGHQFEWAWLLIRWADLPASGPAARVACLAAAARLIEVGEQSGVDARRGVAINELWDDLGIKDAAAKLWPQTERLKAWCAMHAHAPDAAAKAHSRGRMADAARGLSRYLAPAPAGLWRETLLADDTFAVEPCKTSSFYHIACALDTLNQTLAAAREAATPSVAP